MRIPVRPFLSVNNIEKKTKKKTISRRARKLRKNENETVSGFNFSRPACCVFFAAFRFGGRRAYFVYCSTRQSLSLLSNVFTTACRVFELSSLSRWWRVRDEWLKFKRFRGVDVLDGPKIRMSWPGFTGLSVQKSLQRQYFRVLRNTINARFSIQDRLDSEKRSVGREIAPIQVVTKHFFFFFWN